MIYCYNVTNRKCLLWVTVLTLVCFLSMANERRRYKCDIMLSRVVICTVCGNSCRNGMLPPGGHVVTTILVPYHYFCATTTNAEIFNSLCNHWRNIRQLVSVYGWVRIQPMRQNVTYVTSPLIGCDLTPLTLPLHTNTHTHQGPGF